MGVKLYKSVGTTGGTTGKVDSIDGDLLNQGDFNFLFDEANLYWMPFQLDADIGGGENDPLLITPDSNAGNKRWRIRFVRWLKDAIAYAGDIIIKEVGKGLVLGDGAHDGSGFKIYKPDGNHPVRIVPISDSQGIAFRNASDDATIALFKSGGVDISGLVAPSADSDPARKIDVDTNTQNRAWKKVAESVLSNQGSFDLNGLSGYRKLRLTFSMLPQNDNVDLCLRTSSDNGGSFDAGGSAYSWRLYDSSGAFTDFFDSKITLSGNGVGNGVTEGIWGQIILQQFNQDKYMQMIFNGGYCRASDGDDLPIIASGRRKESSGRDAFSLFFATGNIASGHILVEGAS